MGELLGFPSKSYQRWEILQRLNELKKWLVHSWSQKRQDEYDDLREKLSKLDD